MQAAAKSELIDRLPKVRGRYRANADLAKTTWFQVGGPAKILFKPEDEDDLAAFLCDCPRDIPVTILGVGSNLLVRDGGIQGVVIRLGRGFTEMKREGDLLVAGAACLDVHVAQFACDHGIAGLEFLVGIPGGIGGALAMNGGAYGTEIKDVLIAADAIDREGNKHHFTLEQMQFTYRHCHLLDQWNTIVDTPRSPQGEPRSGVVSEHSNASPSVAEGVSIIAKDSSPKQEEKYNNLIFTRAYFKTAKGDSATIATRMKEITDSREASQPIRSRTGGSTFRNPEGHKAWQLVDDAGCRGFMIGGAQVSEKHCNFLINTGTATAADLENLGEEVRRRVKAKSGIELQWEIKRIGDS